MKPRESERCGTSNPQDAESCRNCGLVLDKSKITEKTEDLESKVIEMIENDPDKWDSVLLDALEESKKAEA